MSPWKVILATMVIFACGVLTGAMVGRTGLQPAAAPATAATNAPALPSVAVNPKNPAPPGWQLQRLEFFKRMEKQLDMAPDQRDQIEKIMKESQERTKPLWEQIAPQMDDELKRVRQEVNKVLTPDQRKKMNELTRRNNRKPEAAPGARPPSPSAAETNAPEEKK